MQAKRLWSIWQALLLGFARGFTRAGRRRFVEWITGLALNVEEHTITQSLVGLDRPGDWKALESFAEYGSWHDRLSPWAVAWAVDEAPGRLWYGYHVWAGDDTKVHRTSPDVWGTCTFHEYTARCPNRASTVRPTTGSCSAPCRTTRAGRPGSCRSPAGSTSARRSCRRPGRRSGPSAS